MIDINLIPTKIILRRRRYLNQIRTLSASILVFICVLVCIKIYQQISLDNLKEEVGKIELEKNNFSKIIADIKKIDEEKKDSGYQNSGYTRTATVLTADCACVGRSGKINSALQDVAQKPGAEWQPTDPGRNGAG
jgi:hypothetical protein